MTPRTYVRRDVAAYRRLRAEVLADEPWCPGVPLGIHGAERVPTTQLDHVTPLAQGGAHTRSQVRGLCASCNGRKGRDERVRTWRDV
jgi:5-methylcytosine-specific restriction endonuclease McrA